MRVSIAGSGLPGGEGGTAMWGMGGRVRDWVISWGSWDGESASGGGAGAGAEGGVGGVWALELALVSALELASALAVVEVVGGFDGSGREEVCWSSSSSLLS